MKKLSFSVLSVCLLWALPCSGEVKTYTKKHDIQSLISELEMAGIKVTGPVQICKLSTQGDAIQVDGNLTPTQWVTVDAIISGHNLPTTAQLKDREKEVRLNDPVIKALIEALEDRFPMIRGQLRQIVKDKMQ